MNKFTLKVGHVLTPDKDTNDFTKEILENLLTPYELVFESSKEKAFKIPCQADCGDVTCSDDVWCNLETYYFNSEDKDVPINLIKAFNALIMFDPIIAAKVDNPNDLTDYYFWNRFSDEDDEEVMPTQVEEKLN